MGGQGVLLAVILLCAFLLTKCSDRPETGLNGVGGVAAG
jgi:hypothetical protein